MTAAAAQHLAQRRRDVASGDRTGARNFGLLRRRLPSNEPRGVHHCLRRRPADAHRTGLTALRQRDLRAGHALRLLDRRALPSNHNATQRVVEIDFDDKC